MLVKFQRVGIWDGKRFRFSPTKVHRLASGKPAFAKGSSSTSEFVPTGPWSAQQPYIGDLFNEAAKLYSKGPPQYYPGSTVAPSTPELQATQGNLVQGGTQASNSSNQAIQMALAGAGNAGTNNSTSMGNRLAPYLETSMRTLATAGDNPLAQAGQSLIPSITGAIRGAAQAPGATPNLSTPTATMGAPGAGAGGVNINDELQKTLAGTGMNPYLDQIVQGALRSSNNQFQTQIMPAIGQQASQVGQYGGQRQGVAEGIASGEQSARQNDVIAQLYGNAFDQAQQSRNQALGLIQGAQIANAQIGEQSRASQVAEQLQTMQIQEQIRAARAKEALAGADLGSNMLGQGLGFGIQGAGAATNPVTSLINTGTGTTADQFYKSLGLIPALTQTGLGGLTTANAGALQGYGINQNALDADVEKWFYNQYAPYNALTQFQNYISGAYGSSRDAGTSFYGMPSGFTSGAATGAPGSYQPNDPYQWLRNSGYGTWGGLG